MTMHRLIWQAKKACEFTVLDEGEPFTTKATPVVTHYWFGTTVGFFFRQNDAFGHWYSSNICDPLSAWRVAQFLPRVKTLHVRDHGYNQTLCGLVIALRGDRHQNRMQARASDFGMTVFELDHELSKLKNLWPSSNELCSMWDRLPADAQDKFASIIREGIATQQIEPTNAIIARITVGELRRRNAKQQKMHEDALIAIGVKPEESLHQLLVELGVTNLLFTLGVGDFGEPTHFDFDDLDRQIMKQLIGEWGFYQQVPLLTTDKQPDDPTAHHGTSAGQGISMYWSDFGDSRPPFLVLGDVVCAMVSVRWDRVTERFVLTLRPVSYGESDVGDVQISIAGLRVQGFARV